MRALCFGSCPDCTEVQQSSMVRLLASRRGTWPVSARRRPYSQPSFCLGFWTSCKSMGLCVLYWNSLHTIYLCGIWTVSQGDLNHNPKIRNLATPHPSHPDSSGISGSVLWAEASKPSAMTHRKRAHATDLVKQTYNPTP